MTIPTVSVVVPTYNRADSLGRLLRCIARQSYQYFECLVIDDGSNDQTQAQYEAIWQGLDTRFRLYLKSKDDRRFGPARSRNRGIELAQGAFIAFCDDDDFWIRDDHLSTAVRLLMQYQADSLFREYAILGRRSYRQSEISIRHPTSYCAAIRYRGRPAFLMYHGTV